jgi:hypothetical protein
MKIAYYITSHGFGHGVRACAICNCLSPGTGVIFRTALPRSFFEEEMKRPFEYAPAAFDCGCVQKDGVTVDIEKTMAAYLAIVQENAAALSGEIQWCRNNRIDRIVGDIVPFAFDVARKAGIPSVAVTNFTWYDIYKEYCTAFPAFTPAVDQIKAQYSSAGVLLALSPALPMDYFRNRMNIGPVGRVGRNVRDKIDEIFGISPGKRIGLIYTGIFGMDSVGWDRLERFGNWEFLGLYPLPGSPDNYHITAKKEFPYQDIIASVDCVISKLGYGVYAECVLNGTALIYLPRESFAEYPVLEKGIVSWGGGYKLSQDEYYGLKWDDSLDAVTLRTSLQPVHSDGAMECAREIENMVG